MDAVKVAAGHGQWFAAWCWRHRVYVAACVLVAVLAGYSGGASGVASAVGLVLLAVVPGGVACWWCAVSPATYERFAAGPWRRAGWRWMIRRRWAEVCRSCNLAERQAVTKTTRDGGTKMVDEWTVPKLKRLRARGHAVRLTIRARQGQTLTELETGAERLASTFDVYAYRCFPHAKSPSSTLVVELVMHEILTEVGTGAPPEVPRAVVDVVRMGRTQGGKDWLLPIRGRHTLGVGCSGSGKGSLLWGICCGLAPAVRVDMARLWGIDLKRGVELAMGPGLFSVRANNPADAVKVLRELVKVIEDRGDRMAGQTRLHEPTIGDPLHVLVIDELAALTAYGPAEYRREAEDLLGIILTQGRALGVVVVAFVQDPRKEVVNMRGLFTQVIALRLRSSDETTMVLGDGMHRVAPAHRINPGTQGMGWVVEDTGAVDRVRADYWPDDVIRVVSDRYATEVRIDLPEDEPDNGRRGGLDWSKSTRPARGPETPGPEPRPRKPRSPRKPRNVAGLLDAEGVTS